MHARNIAALTCAGALLAGCGSPEARLPDPNRKEAVKGVARLLDAANQSYSLNVPEGQPTQCSPGKLGDVEVRTCKVCVMTVYTRRGSGDFWEASAKREVFDVAFKRGQSFDQPDISPPSASGGVWVSVIPPAPSQFAPPDIRRTIEASQDIDYQAAANLFGLRYERRFMGQQLFWEPNGALVRSQDVLARLRQLSNEALASMVGNCPAS
jgi:hypothetical protein